MQGYLTRFPTTSTRVFAINDPQAIGADLAAKQLNRTDIDHHLGRRRAGHRGGAQGQHPDPGLRQPGPLRDGPEGGRGRLRHHERQEAGPDPMILMPSELITRDNVAQYKGWTREVARDACAGRASPAGAGFSAAATGRRRRGHMADVVCMGELLIDFVPTVTGTGLVDAPAFQKAPGGAPANVAVGLARLGVSSAFMGKVGDDPFGHFLADTLAGAGVDVGAAALRRRGARTALAFVSLRGRRRARVPVLPPPQRRHAVHAGRGRRGRDRRRAGAAFRLDQPRQRATRAPRRLYAADLRATRRPARLLRRQSAPAALAGRRGRARPASWQGSSRPASSSSATTSSSS